MALPLRHAPQMPMSVPITVAATVATPTSSIVGHSAVPITSDTGREKT